MIYLKHGELLQPFYLGAKEQNSNLVPAPIKTTIHKAKQVKLIFSYYCLN